ncbi:hypothetical protein VTL71DRAFT_3515 [Oculimacula yallundae]|uniref:Uncharacterized protein n=1 Tax=Oculimacula yallundae TaxID=86028 RepID=A0ABR4C7Z0_9HELO
MASQAEQPLVPNHVGYNDAPTLLAAESSSSNKSTSSTSSNERVAEINIGSDRRRSIVTEVEVGGDDAAEGGSVGGEGQKAMREGKQVI